MRYVLIYNEDYFFSRLNVAWEKWLESLTGHIFLFHLGNIFAFSPPWLQTYNEMVNYSRDSTFGSSWDLCRDTQRWGWRSGLIVLHFENSTDGGLPWGCSLCISNGFLWETLLQPRGLVHVRGNVLLWLYGLLLLGVHRSWCCIT